MAEQQTELDANEPATAFKLNKARERGSIFRSADVTYAVVLFACVACAYGLGMRVVDGVGSMMRHGLSFAGRDTMTYSSALAYFGTLASEAATVLTPVMFILWLAAVGPAGLQAGGVFSAQPLQPDFERLNPASGLKRIFSFRSLHEVWRSAARLAVIFTAMWSWGSHHIGALLQLSALGPRAMEKSGVEMLGSALTLLAGVVAVFALLDWGFNRWDYLRRMRMSRREIKDENKEREGDPRIKRRRRQLRVEWLKRVRQLAKVRNADVLLTNPTHVAVALEYKHGEMPAPAIIARGAGDLAQRMRLEARRHSIPIVEHPQLARALFALRESQLFVPEEHFEPVARVLRWVFAARGPRNARIS